MSGFTPEEQEEFKAMDAAYDRADYARTPQLDAYDAVGWDSFSPYKRQAIDKLAQADGVTLHAGTDEATLRRYISKYVRTSW